MTIGRALLQPRRMGVNYNCGCIASAAAVDGYDGVALAGHHSVAVAAELRRLR